MKTNGNPSRKRKRSEPKPEPIARVDAESQFIKDCTSGKIKVSRKETKKIHTGNDLPLLQKKVLENPDCAYLNHRLGVAIYRDESQGFETRLDQAILYMKKAHDIEPEYRISLILASFYEDKAERTSETSKKTSLYYQANDLYSEAKEFAKDDSNEEKEALFAMARTYGEIDDLERMK